MRRTSMRGAMEFWALCVFALAGCDATDGAKANLVAHWPFDEGAGDRATDVSGRGNDATIRNGGWGQGHRGSALQMPGGDTGIVMVPLSDSLRSTAAGITIMAWTYRTGLHNVAVVSHGYPALFFGFHGARFKWQFTRANGRVTACYADPKYVASNDLWIHMAATYNGWIARLYADGVEICSRWAWGAQAMPEAPFTLSGYLNESGQIVDEITGRLDDVRIYARALSPTEIREAAGI